MYWTEDSPALKKALALALRTSASPLMPVLIESEPGCGAHAISELIHNNSAGPPGRRLVAVHCAGCSEEAIAGELFGGAPAEAADESGGVRADLRRGAMWRARGGTLFIEEIAFVGLFGQGALTRSVNRYFEKPDGAFRLIASSSVNLSERVQRRLFRRDLYEGLAIIHIQIPPLRDRRDELLSLAEQIVRAARRQPGAHPPTLSAEARRKLLDYPFPGNVDELRALLERAMILESSADTLSAESICFEPLPRRGDDNGALEFVSGVASRAMNERQRPPTLDEIEREYVIWLLREAGGNRTVAARQMGVSYPTIMKKISDYNIDLKEFFRRGRRSKANV